MAWMAMRSPDFSTKDLFGEPQPGEPGYLRPGCHRNEKGQVVDEDGNVYEEGREGSYVVKEGLGKRFELYRERALLIVEKNYPGIPDNEKEEKVRLYARQLAFKEERERKEKSDEGNNKS